MSYTNILKAGTDHTDWLNSLGFYEDDLKILEDRLAEVAIKNTSFESRQGVEHFQNQFVIQRNNVAELRHKIKEYVHLLAVDAQVHAGHINNSSLDTHKQLEEEFNSLEIVIRDLRSEFNEFLVKWM